MKALHFLCLTLLLAAPAHAYEPVQPLPKAPIVPKDNPQTKGKIALGKQLFFDPRLSRDGRYSCNSCHNLAAGGDDDGLTTQGENPLRRSAPSVWNVGHMSVYFWEGRAKSLEAAMAEHLLAPEIMNVGSKEVLATRLAAIEGYRRDFSKHMKAKYPDIKAVSMALAAFLRSLNTPNSPFDRYLKGDKKAVSKQVQRGMQLFNDTGCLSCHFGANYAGPAPGPAYGMGDPFFELFPNHPGTLYENRYDLAADQGLYHITLEQADRRLFRVAPMRNVALTAPYFHNGSVKTLEEAIRVMAVAQLKTELKEDEVKAIAAFLRSLTGEFPEIALPRLPETDGASLLP